MFSPRRLIILGSLVAEALGAAQCDKDKCLSAASNKPPNAPGCRAFLASTVTPAVVTVTIRASGTKTPPHSTNVCPTPKKSSPSQVPSYASACQNASAYSSACSCLGARPATRTLGPCTTTIVAKPSSSSKKTPSPYKTTKTSTKTTSSASKKISSSSTTSASSTPAPSTCGNQGLQWGYWFNPYPYNSTPNGWPGMDPGFTNYANPGFTGVVSSLLSFAYPSNQTSTQVYGQYAGSTKNFTLNHQGYIWAPSNGTYTFKVKNVNNNFNLWLGDNAYGGPVGYWDRQDALMDVYLTDGKGGSGVYEANFTGGTFNTFRYTISQAIGAAGLSFTVLDPEGEDMFPPGSISPNLVQMGCNSYGPAEMFLPFGYNYEKEVGNCDAQSGCVDLYGNCLTPGCTKSDGSCVTLGQSGCNNTNQCESMSGCLGPDQSCISPGCYQGNGSCVPLGQSGCNTPVQCTEPDC